MQCSIFNFNIVAPGYGALFKDICEIIKFRRFVCRLYHDENKSRRFSFAPWQLARFEATFAQCRYPDLHRRENLAQELQTDESEIREWFVERRMKWRRQKLNIEPSSSETIAG